jgi:hypothetical protein
MARRNQDLKLMAAILSCINAADVHHSCHLQQSLQKLHLRDVLMLHDKNDDTQKTNLKEFIPGTNHHSLA